MAEVLTSPFGRRGNGTSNAAPTAADALPLPAFVASGVARSRARDRGFDGPQYYPLSPRAKRRALSLSGTACSSVLAEPSRWLHSPSSLEASYAGLDRQAALRRLGPTPPATPPAHRVGILHEVAQLPKGLASERDRYSGSPSQACFPDLGKDPRTQGAMEASLRAEEPPKPYGWQERIQVVEEEKKELLRRLEVSNQRNHELELEREGLKTSLQRMEKLLEDLVDGSRSKATREWGVQSYASYHPYNGVASTPLRSTGSCSELGSRGSPLRFRGTSPTRNFSVSILDNSRETYKSGQPPWHDNSFPDREIQDRLRFVPMAESHMTSPKLRAPTIHSGYGLVTEPVTSERMTSPLMGLREPRMGFRDRYNLVDICQNLPPRLKRW